MGNTPSGSNPFATNDVKGDNLRQERELKAILRPIDQETAPPVKFAGDTFNPVSLTDNQLAEINRAQNEQGGKELCRGDECEPNILPIINPPK
tara:strand:+ start:183 stop:461 length:279 start_codon:yes stop_codon:yes gene_type:complete